MGEKIEFTSNGSTASGYLAVPDGGSGPGVVVIQEFWGLVPHICDVADRLATAGFVALAPDLYHGETTTEPDEAGKLMMALNLDRATKDLNGAVDHLRGHAAVVGEGLGVVGFCMGGGLALALACARPDAIKAAAPFYGVIPWESMQPDYSKLEAKVVGQFAELDGFFGPDLARGLESQLRDLGKDATIVIHDGCDHAFFNDTRPEVYDAEHAAEAWEQTLALFDEVLRR
jgi:carboxymethylenebutenolidase